MRDAIFLALLWPASVAVLWLILLLAIPDPKHPDHPRRPLRLLLGAPPTLLLAPWLLLLFVSPTAQGNVGSEWRMDLWSFWIIAYEPCRAASLLCTLIYLLALPTVALRRDFRYLLPPLAFSLASSALAWLVLANTFPSA